MAQAGTVKWFSREKGYGFITDDEGDDVFVDREALTDTNVAALEGGERVEFEVSYSPEGEEVSRVTIVSR